MGHEIDAGYCCGESWAIEPCAKLGKQLLALLGWRSSIACDGHAMCSDLTRDDAGFETRRILARLTIGFVLARSLNRLTWLDGLNEMAVDLPPGSEAERQWRCKSPGSTARPERPSRQSGCRGVALALPGCGQGTARGTGRNGAAKRGLAGRR